MKPLVPQRQAGLPWLFGHASLLNDRFPACELYYCVPSLPVIIPVH